MTRLSSVGMRQAEWLLDWLISRQSDMLPRMKEIGALCPEWTDSHGIHNAFRELARKQRILWRAGTVSENRGHCAVRIIPSGRVLKTAGCPFEPPEATQ